MSQAKPPAIQPHKERCLGAYCSYTGQAFFTEFFYRLDISLYIISQLFQPSLAVIIRHFCCYSCNKGWVGKFIDRHPFEERLS